MSKNKNLAGDLFMAKRAPLVQKESSLSSQIAEYLTKRGLWNERLNAGKIKTIFGSWLELCDKGTPDRITILRGQAVFIETKTFGKKPTREQLEKHEEIRASGGIVMVVNSYNDFVHRFNAIRAAIEKQARTHKLYD